MEPLDQYTRPGVGMIGVGLLGSAVSRRWLKAGIKVVAFDTDPARVAAIMTDGAQGAGTVDEVFQRCGTIALALPHSAVGRKVLAGITPEKRRRVVLDMTTGDPEEMAEIGTSCADKGILYCDTTVGGSSAEVMAGNAIVMAGGDDAALESAHELLAQFAKRIFRLGPAGSGARMKLALNLVLGLNRAVLAEGLCFAESCGLDPAIALEILRSGPAFSKVMDSKGEKMLHGDFVPQARLAQHRKDVDLILQEAVRHGAHIPLSELHRELLVNLERAGYGEQDNSAIIRAFAADDLYDTSDNRP
jgi:3-hydroxyisobutyrate dehydrogenase-like beta-hydroxyacid dehydrogenase